MNSIKTTIGGKNIGSITDPGTYEKSAGSHGARLIHAIGPGLLLCGAAVGVSHLVQSTRAGAEYGFLLLGLVLVACVLKYPFLEFGPRWAAATGETMLAGYRRMGRWAIGLYTLITLATFWIILATVTVVTAGLAGRVFGLGMPVSLISAGVVAACALLLAVGRFRALDLTMKLVITALAVSTLAAVILAFSGLPAERPFPWGPSPQTLWTATGFAFVLALLGWMPIPLDVAPWHSIWTLERARQTGVMPSVRHAVIDFRIGYICAIVLAVAFLTLGALVMYGGSGFSDSAVAFSGQLIDLYGDTLGDWSRPLIAIAALTAMFSTTLAVADAYPRVIRELLNRPFPPSLEGGPGGMRAKRIRPEPRWRAASPHPPFAREGGHTTGRWLYAIILLVACTGAVAIIHFFSARFTLLIDFATTVSFLAAPILAWINLKLVTSTHMPAEHRPGPGLRALAWIGISFLIAFCLIWIGWRLY